MKGNEVEKVRNLVIDGAEYAVSNRRGIVSPGKFEGEAAHAVRDYRSELFEDEIGSVADYGIFAWRVLKSEMASPNSPACEARYYCEDDQGFVTEILAQGYSNYAKYFAMKEEQAAALEEALDDLAEAEAADMNRCDACEVAMINGFRCHETGCPNAAHIAALRKRVEALEEA